MTATLSIRDESTTGETIHEWSLDFLTERITVRELLRSRVYQEVQDYNRKQPEVFRGLVQPTGAKRIANGFTVPDRREIDWKQQLERAIDAFEANRVLILIGDRQAASLEEEIEIKPGTGATFVQLVPLVGG